MSIAGLGSSLAAFVVVMAALAAFLWLLGRYRNRFLAAGPGVAGVMHVAAELPVGLRQRLLLVKVGSRALVLAVNGDAVALLAQWQDTEEQEAAADVV